MNKRKLMLGLACLAAVNVSAVAEAGANPFACVPFESGLYEDVAALVHDGLIYGYTDSTFDAKHPLSRYEMAIFTGKALTSYQSAGPEDRARITKLATQFRDELAGMGASLPGTQKSRSSRKKTGGESGGSKGRIGNVEITGHIEHLWNAERKTYTNETKASSRYKNSTEDKYFDLEVQLNAKANLGGGWTGNVGFYGAKDRGGIVRANENIDGHFDITRAYFMGPVNKRATLEVGRDKSATFKSIAMGEYWNGARWSQRINKNLTLNFTYAKPDYNKKTQISGATYTSSTYKYKDGQWVENGSNYQKTGQSLPSEATTGGNLPSSYEYTYTKNGDTYKTVYSDPVFTYTDPRSVAQTYVNPGGSSITFESIEANYRFSPKWRMDLGWWQTHAHFLATNPYSSKKTVSDAQNLYNNQEYANTHLGEMRLFYQPTRKWAFSANLTKSDRSEQNTAWMAGVSYGRYSSQQPHSWQTTLHYGRCGREAYIKSGSDMKNDMCGGKGLEYYFYYVPTKNIVTTFRYLRVKPIDIPLGGSGQLAPFVQSEYRAEIDWYF